MSFSRSGKAGGGVNTSGDASRAVDRRSGGEFSRAVDERSGKGAGNGRRLQVAIACALEAVGIAAFVWFAAAHGSRARELLGAGILFSLLFAPYPALSVRPWAGRFGAWLRPAPAVRVSLLWLAALIACALYTALTRTGGLAVLRLVPYGLLPIWLLSLRRIPDPLEAPRRLVAAILLLWLPVEFGLLRGPMLPAGIPGAFDASRLLVLDLVLVLFVALRPVRDLGFTFRLGARDVGAAALALAVYATVAIPLGLGIGFLHYGAHPFVAGQWVTTALSIFFFVAVPEEFLFRGLIQNLLEKRLPRARWGTLAIASVIFGASHLDNPPAPNFRYALLATLAGIAYGWVWQRTRKITASACTHAAVDIIWVWLLRG